MAIIEAILRCLSIVVDFVRVLLDGVQLVRSWSS